MINLLPPQQKNELLIEEKWKLIIILGIIVLAFLISLALILLSINIYISGQVESKKILASLEEKEFKASEAQNLEENIGLANQSILKLESFYQSQANLPELLEKISGTLPAGTYLNRFSLNRLPPEKESKFQISLAGFSPTREILFQFKKNLEEGERFKEVYFPITSWIVPEDINFNITLKAK